jgi:predicted phage terminase large subunit-like protein
VGTRMKNSRSSAKLLEPELQDLPSLEQLDRELAQRKLLEFVTWRNPRYRQPRHLTPLVKTLHEIRDGKEVRKVFAAPPRHSKTETVLNGIAWLLEDKPERQIGYVTYSANLSEEKSRKARQLALDAGVDMTGAKAAAESWYTAKGGYLQATGVMGPLTGKGLDVLFVDDPFKNRMEAESAKYRDRVWDWFRDVAETRIEPGGSVLVFATRWHPDDLSGRLITELGWEFVNMPAIDEQGRALWPERWPLEELRKKEATVGPYTWASLYQGAPRPRGGAVFGDVHHPGPKDLEGPYQVAIGVDLAYSKKTTSDHSVAVVLKRYQTGKSIVAEVLRKQVPAPQFKKHLRELRLRYPLARLRFYCSGIEQGSADFIKAAPDPVPLEVIVTQNDKFQRAQPAAAAWNRGDLLVPIDVAGEAAEDISDFVGVVCGFTGVDDAHDDDVDALAAAWDLLDKPAPSFDGLPKPQSERRY